MTICISFTHPVLLSILEENGEQRLQNNRLKDKIIQITLLHFFILCSTWRHVIILWVTYSFLKQFPHTSFHLSVSPPDGEKGPLTVQDDNLCRICMDAVIDCVLLECGHMVTCTKCGKRMNECPICRQYVVRAVHVFKS